VEGFGAKDAHWEGKLSQTRGESGFLGQSLWVGIGRGEVRIQGLRLEVLNVPASMGLREKKKL